MSYSLSRTQYRSAANTVYNTHRPPITSKKPQNYVKYNIIEQFLPLKPIISNYITYKCKRNLTSNYLICADARVNRSNSWRQNLKKPLILIDMHLIALQCIAQLFHKL